MAHLREETLNTYLALLVDGYEGITATAERRSSTEAIDITVVHGTAVAPIPILVEAKIGELYRIVPILSLTDPLGHYMIVPWVRLDRDGANGAGSASRGCFACSPTMLRPSAGLPSSVGRTGSPATTAGQSGCRRARSTRRCRSAAGTAGSGSASAPAPSCRHRTSGSRCGSSPCT